MSTRECSPEQVVPALLQYLPLNRDLVRLGASCSAAAAALHQHLEALRRDFSLGAEPQHPVVVLSPPTTSLQPPVPLGFAYSTAFEPLTRGNGGGLLADAGCGSNCVCCCSVNDGGRGSGGGRVGGSGGSRRGGGDDGGGDGDDDGGDGGVGLGSRAREAATRGGDRTWGPWCGCGVAVPGGQRAYDPLVGGLVPALLKTDPGGRSTVAYLLECGPACACRAAYPRLRPPIEVRRWHLGGATAAPEAAEVELENAVLGCPARLTQQGLAVRLALRQLPGKGWGVVALAPIAAGRFVCLYGGEYLTTAEAEARLRMYDAERRVHALLVVREILPSGLALRINIDATSIGNVARFFNHSCDGGSMVTLICRRRGSFVPAVALFTSRNVAAGEELTFAYGPPSRGGSRRGGRPAAPGAVPGGIVQAEGGHVPRPCLCGADACLGFLPDETV